MKTALVLSGGGANGAFQVGAIAALREKGIGFDVVAGVSVGSLNGALVAQDEIDLLVMIWQNVKEQQIFLKKNVLQMIWRLLIQKKRGVYDAAPLWDMITHYISLEKISKKYFLGFTSLTDGEYHAFCSADFKDEENFRKAIYASSLMPIIWDPVDIIETTHGLFQDCVDGGLHDVTPLSAVLKELPDHIYIIRCNNGAIERSCSKNIIEVIKRTFLDIILTEVVRNDIEELLRINALVLQAEKGGVALLNPKTCKAYKYFKVILIEPNENLGSPIDFSKEKTDSLMQKGRDKVHEILGSPNKPLYS